MDNDEVISALDQAIKNLKDTLNDLEEKKNNIDGPITERVSKFNRIVSKMDMLARDLRNLELQLIQRKTKRELGKAVQPLSQERKTQLQKGLSILSASVAAVGDFKAVLKLAMEFADAADEITEAVSIM